MNFALSCGVCVADERVDASLSLSTICCRVPNIEQVSGIAHHQINTLITPVEFRR